MSIPLKRKFNRHARFVLRFDLVTETVSISQDNLNNTADLYKNFASQFKPVVFNLFHAATHFATQFTLTTPFRKFPVRHM